MPRPPGTLPLAGNGLWFLQPRHKLLDWFIGANHQTGFSTFEISVPSLPPAIVISDPLNVEHVLNNNQLFIKGTFFRSRSWDLFAGNGIINADGDLWKVQRKAGLRFFSNSNLKRFLTKALPSILDDTERSLDKAVDSAKIVDMQQIFLELTTRFMGQVAYDMDMPASLPFSKAFDFASGAIGDRFQNPFWKIKEFIMGAPLYKAFFEVKEFGSDIVASTVEKREKSQTAVDKSVQGVQLLQNNLINSLLDHIPDHQVVADAAMNYLSAGRDTTAQSLTWTLYLLLRYPRYQHLLIEELSKVFPSTAKGPNFLDITYDHVQPLSLPFAHSIFTETLRLYPPVPFELKECVAPTTFPDGTWLPKGSVVIWVPWAMGRSRRIWGENSEEFKPERWLNPAGQIGLQKSAFEFPVFNGGPRSCLGKKLAELLAVAVLARLMWKYNFEEVMEVRLGGCGKGNERKSQNSLTLPMEGGLPVRVGRRV
ncbi:MAG: hypothetical protein L6R41_008234 [Letrouitia leprolyta]|nr:MAG: hypothetical protein L6R41_008234 [Letrouitia leprolyta]